MSRTKTIQKIHEILTQRHEALRQAINGDDSLLKEMSRNSGGDVVDFASENSFGEMSSQLAEVEHRELQNVELALLKMKDGTYGKCDGCAGNIPLARLQALPYASLCIKCKLAAEKAGVDPNSVTDWSLILDANLATNDIDYIS
ncbi:MAG: TraR/DksA family transcriptional regulator [Planctomycetota bacterium]